MAAHSDTRLFFLKTFDVPGDHDAAPILMRKMIGVRGANIRAISTKIRGTRINLSAHDYTDASGEVVPALYKVCATIRAKDEATARLVVTELSVLKDKCQNPARLTWTPTHKGPGAFIGKGATIIRKFNKTYNVRCWFDNDEGHFVIESIERKNVLAAVEALDKRDVSQCSRPSSPKPTSIATRNTNSFGPLVDEVHSPRTINLNAIDAMEGVSAEIKDIMKKALNGEQFPSIGGAAAGAGSGRGKWSSRREDTMAAITATPVPPPAPMKAARPVGLTIKRSTRVPVMKSLDEETPPAPTSSPMEWGEFDDEEGDGFSPQIRRQTSFNEDSMVEDVGPWHTGEAPAGVITLPCLLSNDTRGEAALTMPK